MADLLTIIKVNTGHTPVLPCPALGQYLFELYENGDYQLSVRRLEIGRADQRGRGWRFTTGDAKSWSSRLRPADRRDREIRFEWIKNMSSLSLKED